ncbi:hypothetical protein LJR290_006932 [Variovorax sp. LjRoot290]|uniref:hypothetical protein n=1 Tax=unclassified Variovorax TaxID=663243 RepID=UPI003ECE3DED
MHFILQKILAGAVLLALAAIPAAHAEVDFNTLEIPREIASALPDEGSSSIRQGVSTVEAGRDSSLGGAIFNPFTQPAALPPPGPVAAARPPATPEPGSTVTLTLIVSAAGAALVGLLLRRL